MENLIIMLPFLLLIYFLIVGQYISSLFLSMGILGIFLLGGVQQLNGFLQSDSFAQVASYSLTTIPLYILMAQFVMGTRIVQDLYGLAFRISGGKKGPLGVITIIIGGLLGSVSGSASATSATMAKVSLPELQKRGYSNRFAGATIAVAASLSAIIPPSVMTIIYAVASRVPIGEMFIASIIPGILMIVIFSFILIVYLRRYEPEAPKIENEPTEVPSKSRYIIAIVMGAAMATSIFGGIFTGIFTPTEAGAVGAFLAFIMAILLGKVNKDFFKDSLTETTKITVMTMFIVIGASLFGRFVSLSLIPRKLIALLEPLQSTPTIIIILILVFYFVLFMFIDNIAVLLMTIPIVMPILETIDTDPIWFGVMVMISCTIGLITPPVGTNVFVVGSTTGVSIEGMFKITFIFAIATSIITIGLLILFPQLITWLPSIMLK
ncbi:TRAP transporter large permease [Oceanobacillus halophilus]|uniref:TRAP transporter large permease n=1 Tax=Oceanobacillus halophilus TaxID=930130 RepID=A0A494ZT85_9BACI|nr:TRAP transporter large permease [Oceanobacillus halophilus]RKQ29326.1 TRAP transporter large permease [Oceanobacillus halophilus]